MKRVGLCLLLLGALNAVAEDAGAKFAVVPGQPWSLNVTYRVPPQADKNVVLTVTPVTPIVVKHERYDKLRLFNAKTAGWLKGERLTGLRAFECSVCDALIPASVRVENEQGKVYQCGVDYQLEPRWATVGRLPGGVIGENTPVWISYEYFSLRLDSIVLTADGKVMQKIGQVKGATPWPPQLASGERLLGNIFWEKRPDRLSEEMFFPIMSKRSEAIADRSEVAAKKLFKTLAKLRNGEPVKIVAWGDSVTYMSYLPAEQRWINRFVKELQQRFPKAKIELVNLGWPGKAAAMFFNRPAGDRYNYEEKLLNSKADLVTLEFVNDAGINEKNFEQVYGRVAKDFKAAGFEVIVLTPHYTRPDWMGFKSQKDVDTDPRLYSKMLRSWAAKNGFALADVAECYGQVWRDGIPYNTFMTNAINHPDERGSKLFVDTLIGLFPQK